MPHESGINWELTASQWQVNWGLTASDVGVMWESRWNSGGLCRNSLEMLEIMKIKGQGLLERLECWDFRRFFGLMFFRLLTAILLEFCSQLCRFCPQIVN